MESAVALSPTEERVLILTATDADSALVQAALAEEEFASEAVDTIEELCCGIENGAGAVVLSDASLTPAALPRLIACLSKQPDWSELPVIVLFGGNESAETIRRKLQNPVFPLNIALLERPVSKLTLLTTVQSGVRARRRQYQIRNHLLEQKQTEETLFALNEELEKRISQRTGQLQGSNQQLQMEIAERKRAEITLEREHKLVHLLRVVAEAANSAKSIDEALQSTIDHVCTHLSFAVGHAYLFYDAPKFELVSTPVWHVKNPARFRPFQEASETLHTRIPKEGLVGRAVRTKKAVWLEDVSGQPTFLRAEIAKKLGIKTGVVTPVWVGDRIVAVLEFYKTQQRERDERVLDVLREVGMQLGRVFERAEAEEKLRDHERFATIGQTAAVFAHEISNPLHGISATIRLLQLQLASQKELSSDRGISSSVQALAGEVERMISLLQNFRSLAGPQQIELQQTDVGPVVRDVIALNEWVYSSRGIRVEIDIPLDLPPIMADRDKLKQIILNLCKNAGEAMSKGGKLTVKAFASGELLHIEITDSGAGIPEGLRVFKPFVTTKPHGTGLGLMIVKQMIAAQNGSISYRSEAGQGTTFELTFPLCPHTEPTSSE